MAPKLYGIPLSPAVRAVLLCAKALDLELEIVPMNFLTYDNMKGEFIKKNPQHTIPFLEEEGGFGLPDSHAIMAYLVAQYGKDDSLYPEKDKRKRAIIDHRLHFDSNLLFVRGLYISRALLFHDTVSTEYQRKKLKQAMDILDKILGNAKTKYAAGDDVTIADFSLISTLTTWDVFEPYSNYPHIKAYVERFQKLPCYEANIEGLKDYKERVATVYKRLGM